jgi:hypothetical protein
VVWLEGLNPGVRAVKKVYSVETDIIQAFWCRFRKVAKKPRSDGKDDEEGEREEGKERRREEGEGDRRSGEGVLCICVREQNCLTLFLQTGAVHYVPLPFLVSSTMPIYICTPPFPLQTYKAGLMECYNDEAMILINHFCRNFSICAALHLCSEMHTVYTNFAQILDEA